MYSQEITRRHRAAIVIAIDQSCSMSGRMVLNGWDLSKAEVVSMVVGRLIDELVMRSFRNGEYRHYYDVALIGYSGEKVYSLLGENVAFHPITMLAAREVPKMSYALDYRTINSATRSLQEEESMWVKPCAHGATPMYKMICTVTNLVAEWCACEENSESFPPLVFNITDGEASDAEYDMLRSAAHRLQSIGTSDGNTLFVNVHISSDTHHAPILFPNAHEVPLSIRYAHLLMDISSVMPEPLHPYIRECRSGFSKPPYIAMSYNASMSELVAMLNIGSRSISMGL
ncbi:MAG: VWA domain-containing protein [Alistipes sp.]|nr:VWA domain-containing protein [Alistipes sp.]